jgi:hypothetical protein
VLRLLLSSRRRVRAISVAPRGIDKSVAETFQGQATQASDVEQENKNYQTCYISSGYEFPCEFLGSWCGSSLCRIAHQC